MTKRKLTFAILSIGTALILSIPVLADEIATTGSYDSPFGYDFNTTFPSPGSTTIGTYTFAPIDANAINTITITGTFGNSDGTTTALSDYFLGFGGDETAVEVAACDDTSDNCYSGTNGPYTWTATLTQAQISELEPGLAAGSLDFTYTWGNNVPLPDFFTGGYFDQYVYAGATTLDITPAPEPSAVLFCLGGLAGIVVLRRRFRKV
jgi:hypothetical protein